MSTAVMVVVAVVVIAVLAAIGYFAWKQSRTRRLRRRFGPEYDRAMERHGNRSAAEQELMSREQRHQELELRDLDPRQRELYREQWTHVQEQFVDAPETAVEQADRLVTVVMGERGYPTGNFDEKVTHLSVEHGRTLDHYRRGHAISTRASAKEASTEELRQAMVHYRALFEDLLAVPAAERSATPSPGSAAGPAGSARSAGSDQERAAGPRHEHTTPSGERRGDEQTPRT
ncbi:hypothetical protein GCM10009678_52880 [Actinomadura kijaniata]|uniref:Tfp pilus assembly protein PilE n=1 Tax=Actinomadura namibiensis TaxID=182080 RepID=A0A7W3LQK3_ACTNM|nr:hypothetical protein [Actinomadura namibiensis]MBA8952429.1 Tfp pilus assembly protein PilE [Actinomadura namibiensis]